MTSHRTRTMDFAQPELAELESRARKLWRIVLFAYLVPVTIATHWPRLGFGAGGPIDKFSHFLGFGMLAWMALHAVAQRRAWLAWLAAVAWVYVDERTQAIPALGRVFSVHDMIAGWFGVLCAGALFAARAWSQSWVVRARIDAMTYGRVAHWFAAVGIVLAVVLLLGGAMFAVAVANGAPAVWPVAVYPVGFSGLIGVAMATAIVERVAARGDTRLLEWNTMQSRISPWAVVAIVPITALFYGAYLALCVALFGREPSEDLASDAEGFAFLRRTILVVSALLACVLARGFSRSRARFSPQETARERTQETP